MIRGELYRIPSFALHGYEMFFSTCCVEDIDPAVTRVRARAVRRHVLSGGGGAAPPSAVIAELQIGTKAVRID